MKLSEGSFVLFLLPYMALGLSAAADLASGPSLGLLPLLALGPAFASLKGGLQHVAGIGVASLILSVLLSLYDGLFGTTHGYTALVATLGTSIASLVATHLRQRQQRQLARARAVVKVAQQVLVPEVPETLNGLQVAVS
jgi:hypothetical protein